MEFKKSEIAKYYQEKQEKQLIFAAPSIYCGIVKGYTKEEIKNEKKKIIKFNKKHKNDTEIMKKVYKKRRFQFNEYVFDTCPKVKFFCDIDGDIEKTPENDLFYEGIFDDITRNLQCDIHIGDSSRVKENGKYKYSYHVVGDVYFKGKAEVAQWFIDMKLAEYIDMSVYNTNHKVRFATAYKSKGHTCVYDKKEFIRSYAYENSKMKIITEHSKMEDFYITDIWREFRFIHIEVSEACEKKLKDKSKREFLSAPILEDENCENIKTGYYKYILDNLPAKYYNEYELWLKVLFSCKSIKSENDYNKKLFINFSEKSDKYVKENVLKMWDNVKDKYDGNKITFRTVEYFFRQENMEFYYNFNLNNFKEKCGKVIEIDEKDLMNTKNEDFNKIDEKYKIRVIKSGTGTGKTGYFIKEVLNKHKDKNILDIISRISLSKDHLDRFEKDSVKGFVDYNSYKDSNYKIKEDRISVCINSLMKLDKSVKYNIVYLDELDSILSHLTGKTTDGKRKALYEIMKYYIINCEYCYITDYNISEMTLKFLEDINRLDETIFVYNKGIRMKKKVRVYENKDQLYDLIVKHKKKQMFICSDSKKECKKISSMYDGHGYNKYSLHTAETDISTLNKDIKDGKTIIASSRISYGVNIMDGGFKKIIGFYNFESINNDEMIQQLSRVRKVNDLRLYCKNKNNFKFITLEKMYYKYDMKIKETFDMMKYYDYIYDDERGQDFTLERTFYNDILLLKKCYNRIYRNKKYLIMMLEKQGAEVKIVGDDGIDKRKYMKKIKKNMSLLTKKKTKELMKRSMDVILNKPEKAMYDEYVCGMEIAEKCQILNIELNKRNVKIVQTNKLNDLLFSKHIFADKPIRIEQTELINLSDKIDINIAAFKKLRKKLKMKNGNTDYTPKSWKNYDEKEKMVDKDEYLKYNRNLGIFKRVFKKDEIEEMDEELNLYDLNDDVLDRIFKRLGVMKNKRDTVENDEGKRKRKLKNTGMLEEILDMFDESERKRMYGFEYKTPYINYYPKIVEFVDRDEEERKIKEENDNMEEGSKKCKNMSEL